jgi:O-acetyl-ADP-ribose deacetylase (regulator of RNase III)
MPVIEYQGDLLQSDCNVIIHCCNCFNRMGSGIAKAIAEKWPEARAADDKTVPGDRDKLGTFTKAELQEVVIFNLYGQYRYGTDSRKVEYDALEKGLTSIKEFLDQNGMAFYKVGTYRLGCGLAGGDWDEVKPIIERVFGDEEIHVYTL